MDEGLSKAVVKVFVDLYRQDLIYKDKRLVNWDPQLLTAISDLEVQQVETNGHLWYFRYPVEGADRFITVATTRPESMCASIQTGMDWRLGRSATYGSSGWTATAVSPSIVSGRVVATVM